MDTKAWVFLVLGGLLGFVVSIAANVLINRILNFLADRKLVAQSSRFSKAARFHKRISELHYRVRDKYFYAMTLMGLTVVSFVFSTGLLMMFVALPVPNDVHGNIARYGLLSCALLIIFIAFHSLRYFKKVGNAIDQFEEFDAEFKQRWANYLRLTAPNAELEGTVVPIASLQNELRHLPTADLSPSLDPL